MHAEASLETGAAAALQGTAKRLHLVEVEPGAVDRVFQARGTRGERASASSGSSSVGERPTSAP
jgi:hypothetical protein